MNHKPILTKTIPYDTGEEAVMSRADLKLKALASEEPVGRWSPNYWHPKFDSLLYELSNTNDTVSLKEFEKLLVSGYRGALNYVSEGVPALKVRNVLETGIDLYDVDFLSKDSPAISQDKLVQKNDLIINRSGSGSIGRISVFESSIKAVVTGDVYLLRLRNISPFYVNIFLKTKYGREQIHRFETGVSGQTKVDTDEILNIKIAVLKDDIQNTVESEYRKVSKFHEKAMRAKHGGRKTEYEDNLAIARKELKVLINKTEAVIFGEQKNFE